MRQWLLQFVVSTSRAEPDDLCMESMFKYALPETRAATELYVSGDQQQHCYIEQPTADRQLL
jgi:hypothetical protein